MKHNKPEPFDGKRDCLVVNTWLYKVEQYLTLVQLTSPGMLLTDGNRILYASTFLTSTAAVWWYTVFQSNEVPIIWVAFKEAVVKAFVPEDHIRRARDRLRKLRQTSSVWKYLSDFRNIVLTIPDVTEGEKWDKFCSGLKPEIRLEVMKTTVTGFEEATKIALRVDSALWSSQFYGGNGGGSSSRAGTPFQAEAPTPMEIGNTESRRTRFRDPRRDEDFRNNRCFVCHKTGCRSWKHKSKLPGATNNVGVMNEGNSEISEEHGSDSEN